MSPERKSMKLAEGNRWILMRKPETKVERLKEPIILTLDSALEWIRREKPAVWLGSIASVPEPARFPSGFAITRSLLGQVLRHAVPENHFNDAVDTLAKQWPLESLLDEFEFFGADISDSMLEFFAEQESQAMPTPFHEAVVRYYEQGLSKTAFCITTNWDSLLEKAFRSRGFDIGVAGPSWTSTKGFGEQATASKHIDIYHPHGSFAGKDVVCSFHQEQSQLSLHPDLLYRPTLFLGYSGYEPSIYTYLEHGHGQLWCVRSVTELEIPAKRRLVSRPNTFVFVGDMFDLLIGLGLLETAPDTESQSVAVRLPPKAFELVSLNLMCSLDPGVATNLLSHVLVSALEEPELTARYVGVMRAIVNHVRNRRYAPGLIAALMAAAKWRDSEQTWITLVAHLLRHDLDVHLDVLKRLVACADAAPSSGLDETRRKSEDDLLVYGFGQVKQRANIYRSYVRLGKRVDDWWVYLMTPLMSADLAGLGECCEIWAFEHVRDWALETAANLFDYAATCFYLRGLGKAGRLNEWAVRNVETLIDSAARNSLAFPIQDEIAVVLAGRGDSRVSAAGTGVAEITPI